ncbi:sigma 54-interacting transcriptional regulator [Sporosarcina gallistercoris]|uniref:HTH-type transcriptional regulatory protein TyrR n=1 Tax=Sporosarcina gallistercoris TaxID=2762245 RepID=A0ABR8PGU5_9BACL|nr:sigma 54-interacting transcriptional regulator [Sporosarcina gallistercoris]MBD7907314.1 sigma 54-interacting transcriptional regulator [Sporosarcina gallistercoris]
MAQFHLTPNSVQEVLETHDEDVIVTNHKGIIMKATRISGQRYGIEAEDLIGKSVYDLEKEGIFSPAITPLVLKEKKKVVRIQETKSGSKILITGMPFFNYNGDVDYVISYSYDVSELLVIQDYMKEIEYEMSKVREEVQYLRNQMFSEKDFIMRSKSTQEAFKTAHRIAALDVSVILYGETGTGKSTIAKEIHKESTRGNGPFIELDCATIPESLMLKELVGERADNGTVIPGLLGIADGGTLFLKNIDRIALHLQTKLAKIVKEERFYPIGSVSSRTLNVRFVSSTDSDLQDAVTHQTFLSELYYLLNIVPIHIDPLRERIEDVSALISHFLKIFSLKYKSDKMVTEQVFAQLLQLEWRGNIQELRHVIERMVVQSEGKVIDVNDLPFEYRLSEDEFPEFNFEGETLPDILEQVEMQVINRAKKRYRTTTEMAKILGISQPSVVRKLKKYTQTEFDS